MQQVVLEIGNSLVKAGIIDSNTFLPSKILSSWGRHLGSNQFEFLCNDRNDPNLIRAINNNQIDSFDFFIELVRFVLEQELKIESFEQLQLVLLLPTQIVTLHLSVRSKIIKKLNEQFGFGALFIGEVGSMAALGSAHGIALVIDAGAEGIEISAVSDFCVITNAVEWFPFGSFAVEEEIVSSSSNIHNASELHSKLREFEQRKDFIDFLSSENSTGTDDYSGLIRGFERVLFDKGGDRGYSVCNLISSVLSKCDRDRRLIIMNHVIITGGMSKSLLFRRLMETFVKNQILAVSDYPGEGQPGSIEFVGIPDYYGQEIVDMDEGRSMVSWFGAALTSKYAFSDQRIFTRQ